MDFVYILGNGSKWFNNEIRYSLRSLKYIEHGKVFIVGVCPEWIRGVIHIDAVDSFQHKLKNAIHKIRTACLDPQISERFVLMNDDFIFLRHAAGVADFTLGRLSEAIRDHGTKSGYYYQALKDTRELLQVAGFNDPANYEVHYPMVIEKAKFLEMTDAIDWPEKGYLFRSVYGNTFGRARKKRDDTKLYSIRDLSCFENADLVSTSDRVVLFYQFQKFLKDRFPEPCEYEDAAPMSERRLFT